MTADVSSLVRLLSRYVREDGAGGGGGGGGGGDGNRKGGDLVTRDLLGGCCVVGGGVVPQLGAKKELYPDRQGLSGTEKRPEIMSHDVGLQQRSDSGGVFSSPGGQIQDLNLPPLWSSALPPPVRTTAALETPALRKQNAAAALDLKLRSMAPPPAEYQSVCTLEKVKSALERAERESRQKQQRPLQDPPAQPRRVPASSPSPTSSSTTTSSAKRRLGGGGVGEEGEGESVAPPEPVETREDGGAAEMAAAGCPSCLLYVLISRSNPRCPRCGSAVPLPPPPQASGKKARIDINAITPSAPTVGTASPTRTLKFF